MTVKRVVRALRLAWSGGNAQEPLREPAATLANQRRLCDLILSSPEYAHACAEKRQHDEELRARLTKEYGHQEYFAQMMADLDVREIEDADARAARGCIAIPGDSYSPQVCPCGKCAHERLRSEYGDRYDARTWEERQAENEWSARHPVESHSSLSDIPGRLFGIGKIACFILGILCLFDGAVGPGLALLVIGWLL